MPTRVRPGGRGVPDVAGNADPQTGYQVLVDGQKTVIGGTSAVSPLWAALLARMAQAPGRPFGLLQPALYGATPPVRWPAGFRDITSGNNGAYTARGRVGCLHRARCADRRRTPGALQTCRLEFGDGARGALVGG